MRISDWSSDVCSSDLIGTMYKQINAFEAKKLGAILVAKNIAQHIENHFLDKPHDWKPLVYCWRGGNRSGAMAHILSKIGWRTVQLDGGYKAYRSHVNTELSVLPQDLQFSVLTGPTGSGKSRLLQTLATHRSEERRVGKGWVRTCRFRWSPEN